MQVVAVVPVKTLTEVKTRLAAALSPEERIALMRRTLRRVLAALDLPQIAARVVVSPDEGILRDARAAGAEGLLQDSTGLNLGLAEARDWALARGADALLIALGDLPLLAREQVAALLACDAGPNSVVLAPDRHGTGTNLLLLHPPDAIPLQFGGGSRVRHVATAEAHKLSLHIFEHPATALDLDTPDDLAELEALLAGVTGE